MAQREPDEDEDDTLELTPDMEADEGPDDESEDGGEGEEERDQPDDEGEEEEAAPVFDEDAPDEEGDNATIRRMRDRISELGKENAELRRAPPPEVELGDEPTLDGCDYDEDEFKRQFKAWHERKRKVDDQQAERERERETANREWQRDLQNYEAKRVELKLADYDDAAETVKGQLNLAQQAVIVKAASNPAAFIYALGHSDARLAELAKYQDPIKMAAAIARMEGGVKVVKKRRAPAPDKPAKGSSRLPGGVDRQLEKLEADAERTGDRTQVIAYRKKQAKRGK